ncbi:unnamed protein product [Brugia pahangi]|uniref:G protein-coupled receptor n=1 Tax=Brugia pahangi TaxID=6280 RepID=A0A0N4TFP7_BRUPA|nr:unnamed protein product [Brugia pahangi]
MTLLSLITLTTTPIRIRIRIRVFTGTSIMNFQRKKQIVEARLLATVAVLLSLGFICLLLNCFVWHAVRNAEMKQILLGILTFIVGMSTRDWYRLHGEKLTRALKALLNVSNMLNSFEMGTNSTVELLNSLSSARIRQENCPVLIYKSMVLLHIYIKLSSTSTFDFFGICKCLKLNGKYTPEDLKINEGIPRTPETR